MKNIFLVLILFLFFVSKCSLAQTENSNLIWRDSLSKASSAIWKQKTDSLRLAASEKFAILFKSVLKTIGTPTIPLDSITGITRVASVDGKFRIYTWNVPISDGSSKYFGYIQILLGNVVVIPLKSVNYYGNDFENEIFTPATWYGALYYKLIEEKIEGKTVYTLLGWQGLSELNRKVIDIISVDNAGSIVFGLPVFKTDHGLKSRIMFEYASKSNMTLRYDYQAIRIKKKKKISKENSWLIVFDRLVPMDPSLKGEHKYYVPSGDTYDGFMLVNGYWVMVEDIEVGNQKNHPVKSR
jgi:hypothetical protein